MWGAEYLSRFVEREELGGWMGRRWFVGVWMDLLTCITHRRNW